jgi:spore germination protein GerM
MRKLTLLFFIAIIGILVLAGCSPDQDVAPNPAPVPQPNDNSDSTKPDQKQPGPTQKDKDADKGEAKTQKITVYYVNNEYVMTGDEELEHVLPVEKEITLDDSNKTLAQLAIEELQKQPDDEKLDTQLKLFTINSVKAEGDTAIVDFSSEGLNGGSLQERLVLSQLLYTLTELEGINKVQILIDGQVAESLMGHFMIDEPLTLE